MGDSTQSPVGHWCRCLRPTLRPSWWAISSPARVRLTINARSITARLPKVAATAVLEFVRPSMEFRMNTFLRAQLLPLLRGLSRAGLVGFGVVFTLYFLFAMLLFVLNDPHASAYTEQMADMAAPWLVGLVAVYALSKLAGEMVRTWLEDRGEISTRR